MRLPALPMEGLWAIPPSLLLASTSVHWLDLSLGSGVKPETTVVLLYPFLAIACLLSAQSVPENKLAQAFCLFSMGVNLAFVVQVENRTSVFALILIFMATSGLGRNRSTGVFLLKFVSLFGFVFAIMTLLFDRPGLVVAPSGQIDDAGRVANYWAELLPDLHWFRFRGFGSARQAITAQFDGEDSNPHSSVIALAYDIGIFSALLLAAIFYFGLTSGVVRSFNPRQNSHLHLWVLSVLSVFLLESSINYLLEQISFTLAIAVLLVWIRNSDSVNAFSSRSCLK
jgi:hypothetical protein